MTYSILKNKKLIYEYINYAFFRVYLFFSIPELQAFIKSLLQLSHVYFYASLKKRLMNFLLFSALILLAYRQTSCFTISLNPPNTNHLSQE